jgi:sugar phosphate permease
MPALAGAMLPEKLQASGLGILTTVVSIGSLLSSLAFGALWFAIGLQGAVIVFAAALALAILLAVPLLVRSQRAALDG